MANRARVLRAAREAFDELGLDASLDEVARRAGVGAGTVHRHFPSKSALVDAVLAESVTELVEAAPHPAPDDDPGGTLRGFLEHLVTQGAQAHELARRLGPGAGDVDDAVAGPVAALARETSALLAGARAAGAVRPDLDDDALAALVAAAHAAYTHPTGGPAALALVLDALGPRGPRTARP